MCGIAGVWNLNNKLVELNELEKFTDSLIHRGPDGSGYSLYDNETLGLGHRRLSILDLSENGKQPLEYLNNRYSITYNGEIYNFIELKKILLSEGYNFKSESDTEVILAAYDFWGKDCLKKFNGMWAFAIWDNFKKKLFLSRDRFGVKPLHYIYKQNDFFAFASETIAFKYLSNFKREFDTQLLSRSILSFSSIEAFGYTIFKDVTQLLPGHYIEIKKGQKPVQIKWWSTLNNLVTFPTNYEDQVAYFKEIFEDACRIRMRSDVPLASALSGGVDSSAVYCMLHHLMNDNSIQKERLPSNWQKAFVATFPNTKVDERHYAEEVIKFTNGNAKYSDTRLYKIDIGYRKRNYII
jgi:asparagine synthase (glutamine-hydrolysing)